LVGGGVLQLHNEVFRDVSSTDYFSS